jgi:hypothetical protein
MFLSRILVWTVCLSLALPSAAVSGDRAEAPQPLPKTVAVAAFKNGLAFVVRQGSLELHSGVGRMSPIPNATLGTMWLAPREPNSVLDEVVAYRYAAMGEDPNSHEKIAEVRSALRFKILGAADRTNLTLGYLEHGIGWTPSYMISLTDDKTARITMQAVVMNDAEDVTDADVYFVVGVPNFAYSETPSPMSLQQNLLSFMKDAERRDGGNYRQFSNAIAGQLIADEVKEFDTRPEPSFAQTVTELSGASEEDLFLYSRREVTLERGERATYNVFSSTVGYEHIYEWEVVDPQRVDAYGNPIQNNPNVTDAVVRNNIWHSIRLKNNTKFPWTSAPTMVISGTKPVSQDTLPYTPKDASSNLKITVATDIRSSHEEREVARQQNVQRRHGYEFDSVTVEGKLKLKNYKSKEVRVDVGKSLRGEVDAQSDGGKAVKLGEAIQTDNPLSRLTWEVPLKAGEERVVTYRYKIFVRG